MYKKGHKTKMTFFLEIVLNCFYITLLYIFFIFFFRVDNGDADDRQHIYLDEIKK